MSVYGLWQYNLQTALTEAYAAEDRMKHLLTEAGLMPSGEVV